VRQFAHRLGDLLPAAVADGAVDTPSHDATISIDFNTRAGR
jgi:hypothetical protein